MDGSLVWNWENKEVFGNNLPNENLSANLFKFNLRFPGQYWDEEKGSSYNYHRDYASGLGRYLQSDPIGLNGGANTYGYVGGNSLNYVDLNGLDKLYMGNIATDIQMHKSYMNDPDSTNKLIIYAHGSKRGLYMMYNNLVKKTDLI